MLHAPKTMASFVRLAVLSHIFLSKCFASVPESSSLDARTYPTTPIPPKQDPWYTAPPDYESAKPGTVFRVRPAPGNLTGVVGNSSAAYNVLYRTTNSQYRPIWAVTTLFIPSANSEAWNNSALLSYQIPYDSADLDASPSYALYQNTPSFLGQSLGRGWYVSVPDYEGPLASFTAGVMSGYGTIDSVRAVLSANLGLNNESARVALSGYSGGALASEWAAELAVQYASDLPFVGAALGGLTPNVSSVLNAINGKPGAGLIPGSILGAASQFPDELAYIISQLKTEGPYNRTGFLAALNYTLAEAGYAYSGQDIGQYFVNGLSFFDEPFVKKIVDRDGIMGYHGVPDVPVFAYQAIQDEISPIADVDKLVDRYCGVGAKILYQRNTVGSHGVEETNSREAAFRWLSSVFDGSYEDKYKSYGCTVENVTRGTNSGQLSKRRHPLDFYGMWD